jgi:hypothetical protein
VEGGCELQLVEAGSLKDICFTKSRIRAKTRKGSVISWVQRAADLANGRRSHGGFVQGQC